MITWFAVLPFIAGVVGGKKHLLWWGFISIIASIGLFTQYVNGYMLPNYATEMGMMIAQLFLSFGYIVLCSVFMLAYIIDKEIFYKTLMAKNEQIDSLLTIVGHDISNPLTVVLITVKKLRSKLSNIEDDQTKKYLERLETSSKGMAEVLQQIRDLQAIKKGKVELKLEKVHLNSILSHTFKSFENNLKSKNINLIYDASKFETLFIVGNSTTLKFQILNNIFSNAIKFSDELGTINVRVEVSPHEIEINIKDEGHGIEKDLLEVLFDRTSRTTSLGTSGEKGTGFGMPIVKSFIELNEGRINVISKTKKDYPMEHGTEIAVFFKNAEFLKL